MSLVATCPSCGTVFSMMREQLEASSGQVRCGHCMVVFDANAPLAKALPVAASTLPESAAPANAELAHADLSFVQQAQKQAFWSQRNVLGILGISAFALFLLLATQTLRFEAERIARAAPSLKNLISVTCGLWTCPAAKRLQIDGWRIESSNFQKEGDGAFRLTVQLKNTLQTSLVVPHLELSLLDLTDALLVRRTMPIGEASESIPGGEDRTYHFLISPQANLHSKITGYRLVLFYP